MVGGEPTDDRSDEKLVAAVNGGEEQSMRLGLNERPMPVASHPYVWARHKIAELADSSMTSPPNGQDRQIRQLALDYNLMSAYTAFVAVDATRRNKGKYGTMVHQAVPVPEGVNYHTTVDQWPLSHPIKNEKRTAPEKGAVRVNRFWADKLIRIPTGLPCLR